MAEEEPTNERSPWPIIVLLGLIFLPGGFLAFALWGALRWGRQRPSVVAIIGAFVSVISLVAISVTYGQITSGVDGLLANFSGDNLGQVALLIIPIWVGVSLIVGAFAGWGFAVYSGRQMKKNPYLTKLAGSWRHNFSYRRTPWEFLTRKKNIRALKNALLVEDNKAPLGLDETTDEVVFRYDTEARKHTFMTGASGSGKTITMQSLIHADIEVGKTVVVIDFKRSPKFASKLAAWAEEHGRDFRHFVNGDPKNYDIPRSKGQCTYDPLKSGDTTSKADMVLGMREYDSNAAVYESAMQQLLQVTFAMLKNGDPRNQLNREIGKEALSRTRTIDWRHGGINQLASVVTGNGFYELVAANSIELTSGQKGYPVEIPGKQDSSGNQKFSYVNSPTAKNAIELGEALRAKGPLTQAFQELQGQMRTIIASEYGRWMRTGGEEDTREIDLLNLTSEDGNVILFSLNSDSEPKFAQYVGSMIFSDLTNISAARRNSGADNQVNIYVDEFQAVPPSAVTSLLEKSRESSMALTIAQQSFDQVVASAEKAGEAYLNSILDTCSNFIAHAGATEKSAIRLAEILGKEFVTVYSKTNESDSSFLSTNWSRNQSSKVAAREEERWKFGPAEFMKLSSPDPANNFKASAVWVTKTSADPNYSQSGGATARPVWMIPADPVLVEYYHGSTEKERERNRPGSSEEQFSFDSPQEPLDNHELELPERSVEEERSARFKKAQEFASYEADDEEESEEEEPEDWGYEEIPDGELQEDDEPIPAATSSLAPPPAKDFDLNDLFSGGAMPTIATREQNRPQKESKAKAMEQTPELKAGPSKLSSGLPTRPGSGIPVRRPTTPDQDSPLPNL